MFHLDSSELVGGTLGRGTVLFSSRGEGHQGGCRNPLRQARNSEEVPRSFDPFMPAKASDADSSGELGDQFSDHGAMIGRTK